MLADISDIHEFSVAQHRHATDLTAIAADITAARVPADTFGSVGARFLSLFNTALTDQAHLATHVAERLSDAGSTAAAAANAYGTAESVAGRAISSAGV